MSPKQTSKPTRKKGDGYGIGLKKSTSKSFPFLQDLVDILPEAVITTDIQTNITGWNAAAEHMYGWKAAEVLGQPLERLLHTHYQNTDQDEAVAAVLENGQWFNTVTQLHKNGTRIPVISSVSVIKDDEGKPVGYVGINRDFTRESRANESARQQSETIEQVLDMLPAAVWVASDPDCNFVYGNHYANDLLNTQDGENVSQSAKKPALRVRHFVNGHELSTDELPMQAAARTGQPQKNIEMRIESDRFEPRILLGDSAPLFDERGKPRGAVATFHDITKLRKDEAQRIHLAMMETAEEAAGMGSWVLDLHTQTLTWSDQLFRIFGMDKEGFDGDMSRIIAERVHPEDREIAYQISRIALEEGIPGDLSFRIQLPDGEIRTLKTQGKAIRNEEGQPVKLIGYVQDITAQHSAEEALRESQSMLNSVLDAAPDAMVVINRKGEIILADRQVEAVFGYEQSELVGQSLLLLVPERFRTMHSKHEQNFFTTPRHRADSSLELFALRKDGTEFPAEININHHKVGGELVAIASIRDITERKKVQTELQISERKFSALFNQFHDAVFLLDLQGRYMDANQRAADLLGYTREELMGLSFHEISAEPAQSQNIIERLLKGEHFPAYERLFRRKNGDLLPVEINIELVRDAHGSPMHLQSVVRDISERRKAEEILKASELRYRNLIENIHQIVMETDADGIFRYLSPNYEAFSGYAISEELGTSAFTHVHPEDQTDLQQRLAQIPRDGFEILTYRVQVKSGAWVWVETTARLSQAEDGSLRIIGVARDITNRIHTEKQLQQMKRLYATLSQVNQTIVRIKEQGELFQSICDMVVKFGEFSLAWVGWLDETGTIKPVAASGMDLNDWKLPIINIHKEEFKHTMAAEAIRTGSVLTNADAQIDPRLADFRDIIQNKPYHSSAVVPFKRGGKVVGALGIVSTQAGHFQVEEELALLSEMGMDISFALDLMENERIRQQWADAFEHSAHGMVIGDVHTNRILACNPAFARDQGATIEELIGLPLKDMYRPEDQEHIKQLLAQSDREGKVQFEGVKLRKDGSAYPFQLDLVSVRDENGDLLYRVASQQDITERKQKEDALQAEQIRFSSVAASMPGAICTFHLRPDGILNIPYASKAFEDIFGLTLDDVSQNIDAIIQRVPPDDAKRLVDAVQVSAQSMLPWREEYQFQHPVKGTIWLEGHSMPVREADGSISWYGVTSDITERKKIEEERADNHSRLERITTHIPGFVFQFLLTPDGKFTVPYASAGIYDLYEVTPEQVREDATAIFNAVHPEDAERVTKKIMESAEKLIPWHEENRVLLPSGRIKWVEGHSTPQKQKDGSIVWYGFTQDITERKLAEQIIRESESKYRLLAENITDVIWILDVETSLFSYMSPSVEQLRGYTVAEVMRQSFNDALTPPSLEYLAQTLPARMELLHQGVLETYTDEIEQPCKDGSTVWTETTTRFIQNPETGHLEVYGVSRNITKRKQAETALRISEENYRSLAETSDSAIAVLDREGTILYANPTSVRVWGDPDIIGKTIFDIYPLEYAGRYLPFIEKVIDEQVVNLNELKPPINGKLMWFQVSMSPIKNSDGTVNALLLNAWDITERKLAESRVRDSEQHYRALFEDVPIAIWEQDFSEIKKQLDSLTSRGVSDLRAYFAEHPEEILFCQSLTRITDVNQTALVMYEAKDKQELINATMQGASQGELENGVEELIAIAEGKTNHSWEGGDETITGKPIEIQMAWSVVPGHEQDYSKVIVTTMDITERKQAEEKLLASEAKFKAVFDNAPVGISLLDPKRNLMDSNDMLARIIRLDKDGVAAGAYRNRRYIREDGTEIPASELASTRALNERTIVRNVVNGTVLEDGEVIWTQVSAAPLGSTDSGIVVITQDVTERKQAEEALRRNEALLAEAQRIGKIGHWEWIAPGLDLICSDELFQILEIPPSPSRAISQHVVSDMLTPEERQRVAHLDHNALANRANTDYEYQVHLPSGKTIWLHQLAKITYGDDGKPLRMMGIIQDVTERKQSEEALRQSEERHRQVSSLISDYAYSGILLPDGKIKTEWVSGAFERITGYTLEEINQLPAGFASLIQHEQLATIIEKRAEFRSKSSHTIEYTIRRKDGEIRWLRDYSTYHDTDEVGTSNRITGAVQDITERKQAEEAIKRGERILRLFVEHSPASIAMFDRHMRYIVHSRRYVADYQLPDQNLTGRSHYDVFPEIPKRWKEIHQRCLAGNIERADEDPFLRVDGRLDYVHWEIHPWYDDDGTVGGIILFSEVITERVRAREELMKIAQRLEESRSMLELIIESAPIRVFWKDTESRYLGCNGLFAADAGFHNPAEIIGKRDDELVWNDKAVTFQQQERELIETGTPRMNMEEMQKTPDGGSMWVNVSMVPLKGSDGEVIGTVGIYEDITERKKADKELREAREIFQKTFTSSPFAIALSRLSDRTIVDVNVAMEKLLGYSRAELVGRPANDIDYWADLHERQLAFEAVKREGSLRDFEFTFKTKSGVTGQALNYTETFSQFNDTYLLSTFVDITERKQAEEALKESEARFATAFFTSPVSQSIITQETNEVLAVNDACCRLFEYSREELIGASTAKLNLWKDPAERLSAVEELQRTGRLLPREVTTRMKSGKLRTVIAEIEPISWKGIPCLISTIFDITERKQAETSLTHRLEELELLYQSGLALNGELQQKQVAEKLIEALEGKMNWHHVAIRKYDPEGDHLELLAFNQPGIENETQRLALAKRFNELVPNSTQGLSGWVVRQGQTVRLGDVRTDDRYARTHPQIRSGLYTPMMLGERVVGVISVESEELNAFSESDERLLKTIANQAAVAFENARLFQDVQRELKERIQAEEALRENEAFISAVLENLPIGIAVNSIDPTVKFTYMNDNFPKIYRTSREKLSDMDVFWDVVYEDPIFREEIKKTVLNDTASGDVKRNLWVDIPITRAGEETTYITARNIPFPGKPMVISTVWDVTERKQAETARRTSEERLRMTLQTTSDGFWIIDMEGNFLEVNNAYCEMSGYSREELLHMGIPDVEAFEGSQEIKERIEKVQHEDHDRFETRHRRKDGSEFDVEISVNLLDGESRVMICFCRDITERKRAENEINQRTEDLLLINLLNDAANRGESIDAITEIFTRETRKMFNCQDAAIYMLSPDGQYLEMQSTTISANLIEQIEKIIGVKIPRIKIPVRPGSHTEWLVSKKEGHLSSDPEEIQKWIQEFTENTFLPAILQTAFKKLIPAIFKLLKINSTITVPLLSFDRIIGLLDMSSNSELTSQDLQRVRILSHQMTAVILRKQAEENVRIQLKRITALNEIDRAISSSLDMRLSLDVLLNEVTSQLGVDAASILLLDPIDQTLEFTAGRGFRTNNIRHTHLRLGQGFAGQAGLERRVLHVPDLAKAGPNYLRADLLKTENFVEYFGVPLIAKGLLKGVLEIFNRTSITTDPDWMNYLETLGGQAAIAVDNAQLFEGMQRSNQELVTAYDATIAGWSLAMDLRDKETEGHTQRVTELTLKLSKRLGISEHEQIQIRRGALLHDIGKLGVPDHILLKPGKLTDEEWEIMRQHPTHAYEMLLPIKYLRPALDIPYAHHEKWDGTGYPRKLKGEQIPLAARIFAIIDVWDALRSDRPYRPGWSVERVREHILEQSGKHFDPFVVNAFMKMLDDSPDIS